MNGQDRTLINQGYVVFGQSTEDLFADHTGSDKLKALEVDPQTSLR
jgi:hypothetical protein